MGAKLGVTRRDSRRFRRQQFTDINVTPMVDVMLVLLIIFMVTAPMLTTGVAVDLPDSNAAPLPGTDEPLTVSIKSDGSIYIQKSRTKLKDLAAKLRSITGENRQARIFVRGDRNIDYGKVMRVVGEINGAGFTKVGLVTEIQPSGQGRKK